MKKISNWLSVETWQLLENIFQFFFEIVIASLTIWYIGVLSFVVILQVFDFKIPMGENLLGEGIIIKTLIIMLIAFIFGLLSIFSNYFKLSHDNT